MPSLKTLILLAHGSRAVETLEEMRDLAARLTRARMSSEARRPGMAEAGFEVRGAFLSLTKPDLATAVREAIGAGSVEVQILPLFLFSGKHVLEDVPALAEALRKAHPDVKIILLDPIGRHPDFPAFLLNAADLA